MRQSIPYTIEDIYDKLDAADVKTTISIDEDLPQPIVNGGRAGREEIKEQARDRKCPYHHCNNDKDKDKSEWDQNRDKTCEACGYSNREIHRILKENSHWKS